jgi:outer membrane protein
MKFPMHKTVPLVALALAWRLSAQQAPPPPMHLTLTEAEKVALQTNPRIPAAQFTARAAAQVPVEQRSVYLPNVTGNLTGVGADNGSRLAAGALNNPIVYDRFAAGVTVNQFITDFGRTHNLIGSAKLHAQAQDQTTELTKDQIVLQTDQAYFAVLRAIALLQVARETVKARQLVADQVTALAQSKLKSSLDVSFANVNLSDAQLQLASAENEQRGAEADLATALGMPQQQAFALAEEPMPPGLAPDLQALVNEAIQKRPDLAGLRLELSAAQQFTEAEHDLNFPTIGAIGTAGVVPSGRPEIPGRFGAAGVNVSIPIFNGGLFSARRTEAELRALAAAQNTRDLQNRITRDVKVAYLNATTAFERVGLTARLLDQARLGLDLAQARYNLGLSSIVELSQAQLNLTSAQIVNTSAKYDYQTQRAILSYQIGNIR